MNDESEKVLRISLMSPDVLFIVQFLVCAWLIVSLIKVIELSIDQFRARPCPAGAHLRLRRPPAAPA